MVRRSEQKYPSSVSRGGLGLLCYPDRVEIDDAVFALLWLTLHGNRHAWKSFDWEVTDRLHRKGMITGPANKAKSVMLTDEGLRRSEDLFRELFTRPTP